MILLTTSGFMLLKNPFAMEVCTDGGETHTFLSEGFGRDHKRILEFLENFDREIITADDTDMEEILTTSEEQQRLLEQIFNEYS